MCLLARLAALAGALALSAAVAEAQVRSSVSYAGYAVDGGDLSAVWRDMAAKAPQVLRDARWQAETRIRYRWNVRYVAAGRGCLAKEPVVRVSVRITLPEWQAAGSAPSAHRRAWRDYRERLRRHEEQHRDIALETAGKLHALLVQAPRDRSCNALAKTIGRGVERILAEERRRQSHYDRIARPIRPF